MHLDFKNAARCIAWLSFLTLASFGQGAAEPAPFYLKSDDRVVFYGDSITMQMLYTSYVETYVVTRFPKYQVTFIPSGGSGDRVSGGSYGAIDVRLARDVIAWKPTVMTLMLGMNDGGYKAYDQALYDTYTKGILSILDTVKKGAPDVRFTLIEPSAFDDITRPPQFEGGYNQSVLMKFGAFIKATGEERHEPVANFNAPMTDFLAKTNAMDDVTARGYLPDRTHPGPEMHLIMAESLLKAWNAPALVTSVKLDATKSQPLLALETKISDVKTGDTLSWTQEDSRLPFPVDPKILMVSLVLKNSDFLQALDQESLKVVGLIGKSYKLSIDGDVVAYFTREQLAAGVNLATLPTPMQKQAMKVHALTTAKNAKHFHRWQIQLQVPPSENLDTLASEIQQLVVQQHAAAQPVPHYFELAPAEIPLTNLALNKSCASSDTNYSGWVGGLNDGSWEMVPQKTFATGSTDKYPKYATVDLAEYRSLSKVVVGVPNFGWTKTVVVSLSEDGKTYTDVGSYVFSLTKEEKHEFNFPSMEARYIRLAYTDHYTEAVPNAGLMFTTELEAYGPPN